MFSDLPGAASYTGGTTDRRQVGQTHAFEHDSGFTSPSSEDNRIPLVAEERTTVGGVIAIADVASIAQKEGERRSPRYPSPP